jgi:glycosyltransferase involved in cell wall biosynthesis
VAQPGRRPGWPGPSLFQSKMILFLHNRYRVTGGEERVVEDLMWLVRERLGEPVELLARESTAEGATRAADRARAAAGLLRGGLDPGAVANAVRVGGARVVHAHNINPTLGWRALAAARAAGARVVLHLHQYRLVCAVGVCFTQGEECVRCHGRNTLPGVLRNCREGRGEALVYGAALALWQRRVVEQADAVIVPSEFARERLRELGAPLPWERVHVLAPPVRALAEAPGYRASSSGAPAGTSETRAGSSGALADTSGARAVDDSPPAGYALVVSRLAPEKGIDVAIEACRRAEIPLVVAGEGFDAGAGALAAQGGAVHFVGGVDDARLARLRAGAVLALVPSRSAETFGLAAAEAMAAGLPVAASRVGALPELVGEEGLAAPGDAGALAAAIVRLRADPWAGERALERVRARCAPDVVAGRLAEVYEAVTAS